MRKQNVMPNKMITQTYTYLLEYSIFVNWVSATSNLTGTPNSRVIPYISPVTVGSDVSFFRIPKRYVSNFSEKTSLSWLFVVRERILSYLGLFGCWKVLIKQHYLFVVFMTESYIIVTSLSSSYISLADILYSENAHNAYSSIGL